MTSTLSATIASNLSTLRAEMAESGVTHNAAGRRIYVEKVRKETAEDAALEALLKAEMAR